MRKARKVAIRADSEWWLSGRLLIISALSFAGAIASWHFLTKARSAGDFDSIGRWAFLCVALYFVGMACIFFPLVRRVREQYAKKRALRRALEEKIALKRKFQRKISGRK